VFLVVRGPDRSELLLTKHPFGFPESGSGKRPHGMFM
jgi:hypothetical protein